jgi:hypothetical protein
MMMMIQLMFSVFVLVLFASLVLEKTKTVSGITSLFIDSLAAGGML